MTSDMAYGFDAAVTALRTWSQGFYSENTKEFLNAAAEDLERNKATILASVDRNPEGEKPQALSAKHETAIPQGDARHD